VILFSTLLLEVVWSGWRNPEYGWGDIQHSRDGRL